MSATWRPIEVIRPGDRVFFEPARATGTAAPQRSMRSASVPKMDPASESEREGVFGREHLRI